MDVTTVGLDLAENVFHLVGLNAQGKEKMKKRLSRGQVLKHFDIALRGLDQVLIQRNPPFSTTG